MRSSVNKHDLVSSRRRQLEGWCRPGSKFDAKPAANLAASAGHQLENAVNKRRRGVAATEFAVCLPVILLLLFGMIEACTMIHLKQSLTIAAYEGGRRAVEQAATKKQVEDICDGILKGRRVRNSVVAVSPTNLGSLVPGDYVTLTVSAPCDSNSVMRGWFFQGKTIQAQVTMMKEY